jgi:putative glycosyltransferase (TIGR04372 family)
MTQAPTLTASVPMDQATMAKALIALLSPLVGPAMPGRRRMIYIFTHLDRIGQIGTELTALRTLFGGKTDEMILIAPHPSMRPRANKPLFETVSADFRCIYINNEQLVSLGWQTVGVVKAGTDTWVLLHQGRLIEAFIRFGLRTHAPFAFRPLPDMQRAAQEKMAGYGLDPQAPTVTLHIRDGAYLPAATFHSYRDTSLDQYHDAVMWLLQQGANVVRLGDPSMRPLPFTHPRLCDLAHHANAMTIADLEFLAASRFLFGTTSGPFTVAQMIGTPVLCANASYTPRNFFGPRDMVLYKPLLHHASGRNLRYSDIVLSTIPSFISAEAYEAAGIAPQENTAAALLTAVQEMWQKTENDGAIDGPAFTARQQRYQNLNQIAQKAWGKSTIAHGLFAPAAFPGMLCSASFMEHADFLGEGAPMAAVEDVSR